ncbi:hypothetical protein MMC07_008318 [Pseudocyphellaria aurata]|nr:hypothetical protein [Pseudocyphellaria aurata]
MPSRPPAKRTAHERNASLSPPPSKRKLESTTTKKAVASFFTPASQKQPDQLTWRIVNSSLLVGRYRPHPTRQASDAQVKRRKIAAFDLDSTLIDTISGGIFAKDSTDWRWWHNCVPNRLKQLHADGYVIVVLTNQGSISLKNDPKTLKSDQKRLADFKAKVDSVFGQLDFPITLLAATARDQYRKPRTRMWNEVVDEFDLDTNHGPDMTSCFFVGDAGGRPAKSNARADHSCSDRNFATNVGIEFQTPEEYFLHEAPGPFVRDFEPSVYLSTQSTLTTSTYAAPMVMKRTNALDLVLLCGSPGSGKSSFYWNNLKPLGYERVNQDLLKTRDKCVKVASAYISEHKSVVIDNTNADPATRAVWIQLAQALQTPIRCVYLNTPAQVCEHNDTVRALAGDAFNPEKRSLLPHSAFSSFQTRFQEPKAAEGFQDVTSIAFQVTDAIPVRPEVLDSLRSPLFLKGRVTSGRDE